ncbi:hypothetical protein K501DRAFT_275046 [Backusella circina FSU 941]|nr:hypothetical protein K501DRAFT_275046 [Backusella circina FSU 941]
MFTVKLGGNTFGAIEEENSAFIPSVIPTYNDKFFIYIMLSSMDTTSFAVKDFPMSYTAFRPDCIIITYNGLEVGTVEIKPFHTCKNLIDTDVFGKIRLVFTSIKLVPCLYKLKAYDNSVVPDFIVLLISSTCQTDAIAPTICKGIEYARTL